MSDDKTNRGPQDRARINVNEDYEVRYWTKRFNVSEEELRRLVQQHGVSAASVEAALHRKAS